MAVRPSTWPLLAERTGVRVLPRVSPSSPDAVRAGWGATDAFQDPLDGARGP